MRIACIGYRDWALAIYDQLARETDHVFLILRSKVQFSESVITDFKPDLVLFYGWSWIVPIQIIDAYTCLMLHPSPLPRYRGGSPLQNQIIAGEKNSMVTIFVMTNELDAGDIVEQEPLSLEDSLDDIFDRIKDIGTWLTQRIINCGIKSIPQDQAKATYCKRRKPEDSEITADELKSKSAQFLYDKIRMLANPYPNAFIRTADGKKLMIMSANISEEFKR
jgi:methionyl-tRNA formyltransferase